MCIIVVIPPGVAAPSEEIFERCYSRNDDGIGMMFTIPVEGGKKLKIGKYTTFARFYKTFTEKFQQYGATSPFVVHFRLASQGTVSLANTHPFMVNQNLAFVHNGTISDSVMESICKDNDESDTSKFNKFIMKELPDLWWTNKTVLDLIKDFVSPSRLVFLNSQGEYLIFGEHFLEAKWIDGCWYSCKIPPKVTAVAKEKAVVVFDKEDNDTYYPGHTMKKADYNYKNKADYGTFIGVCDSCGAFKKVRYLYVAELNNHQVLCSPCFALDMSTLKAQIAVRKGAFEC